MSETSVPDQSESLSGKLVALAGNEPHNINTGYPVDDWKALRQQNSPEQAAVEWMGPLAFAKALGRAHEGEHDFGNCWGPNGDQRVSLRMGVSGEAGLLYVHDPTWDEYAVLATTVPLAAVEDACVRCWQFGEQLSVEDLAALLPNVPVAHQSRGPEQ